MEGRISRNDINGSKVIEEEGKEGNTATKEGMEARKEGRRGVSKEGRNGVSKEWRNEGGGRKVDGG